MTSAMGLSLISSVLLRDIPRHDTCLSRVGRGLNALCCSVFAHIVVHILRYVYPWKYRLRRPSRGPLRGPLWGAYPPAVRRERNRCQTNIIISSYKMCPGCFFFFFFFFFVSSFLSLRRMGKSKSQAPTLPRIRYISWFDLTHAYVAIGCRN